MFLQHTLRLLTLACFVMSGIVSGADNQNQDAVEEFNATCTLYGGSPWGSCKITDTRDVPTVHKCKRATEDKYESINGRMQTREKGRTYCRSSNNTSYEFSSVFIPYNYELYREPGHLREKNGYKDGDTITYKKYKTFQG